MKNNSSSNDVCSSLPATILAGVLAGVAGCDSGDRPPGGGHGAQSWCGSSSSSDESGAEDEESMYSTRCFLARPFLGLVLSFLRLVRGAVRRRGGI